MSWKFALATLAAALVAWLVTPDLVQPARLLTVFLLSFFPALLLAQGQMAQEVPAEMPRSTVYLSSSLGLWALAGITYAAARASGFSLESVGLVMLPPVPLLLWSLAATLAGLAILVAGRALRLRETPLLEYILPRTVGEKVAFVGVSITAGVCEELVFRGFLIPAASVAFGSIGLAVLLSSAVFGLLHAYQGVIGIVRTGILGFLLVIPLLATGSLLPSILAHTALDVIVGLWLADGLLRRQPRPASL
ncbi:MAG TPA: CPBP family intramembrane glutamic endopeptidase [Longimicrobiaceae bacterium]|nr:CPBP family intramembrane glutamic endopeptidase [Longimicrobiaceae bacterium]